MNISECMKEYKKPILIFVGGSLFGCFIGYTIYEYLEKEKQWKWSTRKCYSTVCGQDGKYSCYSSTCPNRRSLKM